MRPQIRRRRSVGWAFDAYLLPLACLAAAWIITRGSSAVKIDAN